MHTRTIQSLRVQGQGVPTADDDKLEFGAPGSGFAFPWGGLSAHTRAARSECPARPNRRGVGGRRSPVCICAMHGAEDGLSLAQGPFEQAARHGRSGWDSGRADLWKKLPGAAGGVARF